MTNKPIGELLMVKIIPEILEEIKVCTTEEEVKIVLKKNQSPALKEMLWYVFSPAIKFTIMDLPKYRPDEAPIGLSPTSLFSEMRRLYIFLETKNIPIKKKKELLIQLLEAVHPTESVLLGKVFKKNLEIPLLTKEVVLSVFPDIELM